jgi:hypothetical protein
LLKQASRRVAVAETAAAKHRGTITRETVMTRILLAVHRDIPTHPPLRRLLQRWLQLGVLAMLCLPAARGHSVWIGWLPYWLGLAPMICLLLLDRQRLLHGLRSRLATRARRQARNRQQARRRPLRGTRQRFSLAALLASQSPPGV